jgi:3-hydroxyacyl-[acyl-carrier-protein] dehydratase
MDKSVEPAAEPLDVVLDVEQIMDLIPHRQPFLLIDKVKDIVPGESACGVKNVTINEPFFAGHFPAKPIMPGVLIIESMAQTAAAMVMYSLGGNQDGMLVYFMSVDEAKFRKPVVPGDTVEVRVAKQRSRGNVWRFRGEAYVDGVLKAEAVYSAMIVDNTKP